MEQADEWERTFELVSLKMADQVPADGGWQRRRLVPQFLGTVLGEIGHSQAVQRRRDLRRDGLGDGNQRYFLALPAGTGAGQAKPLLDRSQAGGERRGGGYVGHGRSLDCRMPEGFAKITGLRTTVKLQGPTMADIRAFRAFRYDPGRVGSLSDVVAPPYDVIFDSSLQQALLHDRSPYNVIRLILNKESPADTEHDNRYTRLRGPSCGTGSATTSSARTRPARSTSTYQDFEAEGRGKYTRRGFLARVRLEPFGTGRIYPHEETLAGPKADRLKLFRATGMNLSPVFGLYPDPNDEVNALLDAAVGRALPLQATDHLGVVSKLWPVTDDRTVERGCDWVCSGPSPCSSPTVTTATKQACAT